MSQDSAEDENNFFARSNHDNGGDGDGAVSLADAGSKVLKMF